MMRQFAIYQSPIGYIKIEHMDHRLTQLQIVKGEVYDFGRTDSFTDMLFGQLMEYLRHERTRFDVDMDLSHCTPFQRLVLNELLKIPYGERRTYKQIATSIGNPKASRAVGMANNRNPIHIIVPCHRVVGSNGAIVGYAAGVEVKEFLLKLEQCNKK